MEKFSSHCSASSPVNVIVVAIAGNTAPTISCAAAVGRVLTSMGVGVGGGGIGVWVGTGVSVGTGKLVGVGKGVGTGVAVGTGEGGTVVQALA
jgi:hypothetical protein